MKFSRIVVLAGWVVVSGGLVSSVTAECSPPSEEEITTTRAAMFAEADTDKSHTLSVGEFATFTKLFEAARAQRHFTCLDANGDGQVSAEELAAHRPLHGPYHRRPF
jgi:Ca2+-binding EF-hand superfamily protein